MKQKRRQGIIQTTLKIGIILLFVLASFNILNSISINPGDAREYRIDSPLETYTFQNPYNVSMIIKAPTYIVFNSTGFNVTPSNPISIRIDHIDSDIDNPYDGDDDLVVFTITETGGETWFNISGFEATLSYTVKANSVFFSTEVADASGDINFFDNPGLNTEYSIYWTAGSNSRPTITNPVPGNSSTGISLTPTLFADIADPDSNLMDWYMYTNDTGDWTEIANDTGISDSTISNASTGHFTTSYTKYWWSVNVTDATVWTNHTYHFTTTGSGVPVVQTNNPTNVQEINVTLQGELLNDGGSDCTVWFEWGNITNHMAHNTSNQTRSSGEIFSNTVRGNLIDWYDTDWLYRKKITIDGENFLTTSNLTNFPLLVNDTDSDYLDAREDGYDFVFTASDGTTQLYHEIERFTYINSELIAWVNVTNISMDTTTDIYLYWGNLSSTNQQNVTSTWDTNVFTAVYHLDEQTGSTVYDSTSNQYDANYSGDMPTRNATRIGWGQYLDGDNDYISFPAVVYNRVHGNSGGYSAQIVYEDAFIESLPGNTWVQYFQSLSSDAAHLTSLNMLNSYTSGLYQQRSSGDENGSSSWSDGDYVSGYDIIDWFYYGHTWNPSSVTFGGGTDGTWDESRPITSIPQGSYSAFYFGVTTGLINDFKGYVDEIRIYNKYIRNDSWIQGETFSAEQTAGWTTYNGVETYYQSTGNVSAGTLYYCKAVANNTDNRDNGDTVKFITAPYEPTLFAALTENKSAINLTWVQLAGSGYNNTYIERSESSVPWARGTNYAVYNDTALYHVDINLSWGDTYYYQAWSFANWTDNSTTYTSYSINFDSASNTTNSIPFVNNVIPSNHSVVDVGINISIDINDPDGDTFNWTIEIQPNVGSSNHNDDINGTKTCGINTTHDTNYTWYVNITDGYDWSNFTYNFTAMVEYVDVPTGGNSVYDTTNNKLNLSWSGNDRADAYTVVQRNDTYSSSATQSGNWIRQNTSSRYWNNSWTTTSGGYFTIYSYNTSANMHSYNNATPSGLDIAWGALAIDAYNESNMSQGIDGWNIEISDSQSQNVYTAYDQSNTVYLDINDIPFGEDTIFVITADGYRERVSYHDLYVNNFYDFNFYLPPYTSPSDPGGGDPGEDENVSTTRLYRFRVIDEYLYPVNDATVQMRRYNNVTGEYINISTLITNGYGEEDIWLIPGVHYRAFISKDGFNSDVFDWIPDPVFYGSNYPKIFQITGTTEIITTYTFHDLIRFNATLHTNGSLFVNYIDYDTNTTNAQFYVYENYNFSGTYITMESTTSNTFSFWVNDLNFSRLHEIVIYLNHTVLGFEIESIFVGPVSDAEYDDGGEIERKIENVFGPFRLGYVQLFLVYLPIMFLLVLPGPKHPGFAIIMASLYAGFASSFIVVGSILVIIPFAIAIGAVLMAVKGGMFKL